MAKPTKIGPQTYRIGDYVAFLREDGRWQLGQPIDRDDPIGGGFVAGTVTYHLTLAHARRTVTFRARTGWTHEPKAECA